MSNINKPYNPVPFRDGNKVVKQYEVKFEDAVGNKAMITKVDYINSKGKLIKDYTLYVKWYD